MAIFPHSKYFQILYFVIFIFYSTLRTLHFTLHTLHLYWRCRFYCSSHEKRICADPFKSPQPAIVLKMDKIHVSVTFPWVQRQSPPFPSQLPRGVWCKTFHVPKPTVPIYFLWFWFWQFCKPLKGRRSNPISSDGANQKYNKFGNGRNQLFKLQSCEKKRKIVSWQVRGCIGRHSFQACSVNLTRSKQAEPFYKAQTLLR